MKALLPSICQRRRSRWFAQELAKRRQRRRLEVRYVLSMPGHGDYRVAKVGLWHVVFRVSGQCVPSVRFVSDHATRFIAMSEAYRHDLASKGGACGSVN